MNANLALMIQNNNTCSINHSIEDNELTDIPLDNKLGCQNDFFNVLNKKRLEEKDCQYASNKLHLNNSNPETLNNSASTNNNTLNITHFTINQLNLNNTSNKNNLLCKFSPIPKPDFSFIERKENCFSYRKKGSYKKPKYNVPDSPIKTPNKYASTPGNGLKLGKRQLKKAACRKLNFFSNLEEEDFANINPSSDFINELNLDNIKIAHFGPTNENIIASSSNTSKNVPESSDFKNPFINFNNLKNINNNNNAIENSFKSFECANSSASKIFPHKLFTQDTYHENKASSKFSNNLNFMAFENQSSTNCITGNPFSQFEKIHINNKNSKNQENEFEFKIQSNLFNNKYAKRVCFVENETSEFQLNDPTNDVEMKQEENLINFTPKKNPNQKSFNFSSPIKNTKYAPNPYLDRTEIKSEFFRSSTKRRSKYLTYDDSSNADLIAEENENEAENDCKFEVSKFELNDDNIINNILTTPKKLSFKLNNYNDNVNDDAINLNNSNDFLLVKNSFSFNMDCSNNNEASQIKGKENHQFPQDAFCNSYCNENDSYINFNNNNGNKNLKYLFNDDSNKKNFSNFFNNPNNFRATNSINQSQGGFINKFFVSEFVLEQEEKGSSNKPIINPNFNFENKNNFSVSTNMINNENSNCDLSNFSFKLNQNKNNLQKNLASYSDYAINYQQIRDELNEFASKKSDLGNIIYAYLQSFSQIFINSIFLFA